MDHKHLGMIEWLTLAVIILAVWIILTRKAKKIVERRNIDWISIPIPGIVMLRTARTGIFDILSRYKRFFSVFEKASVGVILFLAVLMVIILSTGVFLVAQTKPEPTGIFAVQNMFVIPGVNQFIPSTFAVWIGLVVCIFIHEFGHGIVSRVENIRVKYTGVVLAVIPIGFFVDPDEEELKAASRSARAGMISAGVANNIIVGLICFGLVMGMIGLATPRTDPKVYAILEGTPSYLAGMEPGFIFTEINGIPVTSQSEVVTQIQQMKGGTTYTVKGIDTKGSLQEFQVTMDTSQKMGIFFYPGGQFLSQLGYNPFTFFGMMIAPLSILTQSSKFDINLDPMFSIFAFDGGHLQYYVEPFYGFFALIHTLFWIGWFSLNVGLFNALPMLPLDGGLVVKEYLEPLVGKVPYAKRYTKYAMPVLSGIIFLLLIEMITLPYQFKLFGGL